MSWIYRGQEYKDEYIPAAPIYPHEPFSEWTSFFSEEMSLLIINSNIFSNC